MPNWANLELSGHIGRIKTAERYADFSVAFNPGKKEDNKQACWFQCRAVGKAKPVIDSCEKGSAIKITKCAPETWKDRDGNERWSWIVFECEKWAKEESTSTPHNSDAANNYDDDIPF